MLLVVAVHCTATMILYKVPPQFATSIPLTCRHDELINKYAFNDLFNVMIETVRMKEYCLAITGSIS